MDFTFAQTSHHVHGLGGLNTSSRRIFPTVSSPLSTSLSTPSSRGSTSSTVSCGSNRSNVRTPIGSITPRESVRVRKHHRDMHLGARTGYRSDKPVGWAMSHRMEKLLVQEPMQKKKIRKDKPSAPLSSQFGLRAEKNPITKSTMRARRGNRNQHRIFADTLKLEARARKSNNIDPKNDATNSPRNNKKNQPFAPPPQYPSPPPRPPRNTPPTTNSNNNPSPREQQREKRRIEANRQRRNAGPLTGTGARTEPPDPWQGIHRSHRVSPPGDMKCPWNNVSPAMNSLLTDYNQPTKEQRENLENGFHGSVSMPEGGKFRPKKGGLAKGTNQNFGGRGKSVRWSQSKDAPKWMVNQNTDKEALIAGKEQGHSWATGYEREGMTGTVGDFSISAEGPTWLVDTMERYDPSLVLKKVPKGGHKTFGGHGDHGHMTCSAMFEQEISDDTISGDMPSWLTEASGRINETAVRDPRKQSWYNKKVRPKKNQDGSLKRHSTDECKTDSWTYSLGGVRSTIDFGNGVQITDSSVSGDAPTWMEELSNRTDPGNVIRRSNNTLNFVNKHFEPEIEKIEQCWTDSTVSGDGPSWMVEQNQRVDPRIVREHKKYDRPWAQKHAPTSKRPFPHAKHKPNIRDARGRTKTKKRYGDGRNTRPMPKKPNLHKPKVKRAPEGPVNMRNVSHGVNRTSTGRYPYA